MFCTSICCDQGPLPAPGAPGLWRLTACLVLRVLPVEGSLHLHSQGSLLREARTLSWVFTWPGPFWSCWDESFPHRLPGSRPQLPATSLHVSSALGGLSAQANPTQASAGPRPCRPSPACLSRRCWAGGPAAFPLWPKARGSRPWSWVPVPGPALRLDQVDK